MATSRQSDIRIRTATAHDAAALVAAIDEVAREGRYLSRSTFQQDPAVEAAHIELTIQHGGTVLLAEVHGQLAGWLTLQRDKTPYRRHVCLLGMGVLRPYRHRGLGKALLEEALRYAREAQHIDRVELAVRATNLAAIGLYQSVGFVYEGRRIGAICDDTGTYDDEILMAYHTATDEAPTAR